MTTIPYNFVARDDYRDWLSQTPWNIGVTVQPANPRYNADDMEALASMSITRLEESVGIRKGLWIAFVREQSRDRGLWHLHGLIHLKSRKRVSWMLRQGESHLLQICHEFAEERGGGACDPSVHLFSESAAGSERWMDYINKEAFRDTNSDRWLFGRPQ
jgi:hypothetical protein